MFKKALAMTSKQVTKVEQPKVITQPAERTTSEKKDEQINLNLNINLNFNILNNEGNSINLNEDSSLIPPSKPLEYSHTRNKQKQNTFDDSQRSSRQDNYNGGFDPYFNRPSITQQRERYMTDHGTTSDGEDYNTLNKGIPP